MKIKAIVTGLMMVVLMGITPMKVHGDSYLDRPFNNVLRCEVCRETKEESEIEIWYDRNNIKHYTCIEKCTNGLDILYGPMVREKEEVENEPIHDHEEEVEYVYWNGGRSTSNKYHKHSNCSGMKGAVKMTREEAENRGYVACKKCY